MRKTMMEWVVTTLALIAVLAVPSDGQSQASPATPGTRGTQMAVELEFEASRLHAQLDRWAYAAHLYLAAVQLREDEGPQAQEDLLLAANLTYQTGNTEDAIIVLESAGSRALASGDVVRAADLFTDAAWVAKKAGLRIDQRRLSSKAARLADSSELTRAERSQILSRFEEGLTEGSPSWGSGSPLDPRVARYR